MLRKKVLKKTRLSWIHPPADCAQKNKMKTYVKKRAKLIRFFCTMAPEEEAPASTSKQENSFIFKLYSWISWSWKYLWGIWFFLIVFLFWFVRGPLKLKESINMGKMFSDLFFIFFMSKQGKGCLMVRNRTCRQIIVFFFFYFLLINLQRIMVDHFWKKNYLVLLSMMSCVA